MEETGVVQEINAITDIDQRIARLKKRATTAPDVATLLKDWDPNGHAVMDEAIRKKKKVIVEQEVRSADGKTTIKPEKVEWKDPNRLPVPIEQDIVNIQTSFTFGIEPKLECVTTSDEEKNALNLLKQILVRNKIKYLNKKVMRAFLAEQEVAEYWYKVTDGGWWSKLLRIVGLKTDTPQNRLRVAIWSPFNGDKLYPIFDSYGDLVFFSREYKVKDSNNNDVEKFMTLDAKNVTICTKGANGWAEDKKPHGFTKMPVIYTYRSEAYCKKIKRLRERYEMLLSNYADCIDYNFAPKLMARGVVEDIRNGGAANEIIEMSENGELKYLIWTQAPDNAKLELDTTLDNMYNLTNTPRLSMEALKGMGDALSGVGFRYMFMGAHMAVYNHAEVMGEYLQRRINFLCTAIGDVFPKVKDVMEMLDPVTEIVPYIIDNKADDVDLATSAIAAGIMSKKEGVSFVGLSDNPEETLKLIAAEENRIEKTPLQK